MNKDDKDYDAQIEKMMTQITLEKAPASLSARLHRIPEEESRKQRSRKTRWSWLSHAGLPRWAPALAAVPLVVLAVMLMQPQQPSKAEVEQARQDLALAFAYLDKVGAMTGHEIQAVLGTELRRVVKDPLSEHMPFTEHSLKEEST